MEMERHKKMRDIHPGNFNMIAEMMVCRIINQGYFAKNTRWTPSTRTRNSHDTHTPCTRATQYPIPLLRRLSEVLKDSPCVGAFLPAFLFLLLKHICFMFQEKNLKLSFSLLFFRAKIERFTFLLNIFVCSLTKEIKLAFLFVFLFSCRIETSNSFSCDFIQGPGQKILKYITALQFFI